MTQVVVKSMTSPTLYFLRVQFQPLRSTFRRQIERNDSGAMQEASNIT